MSKKLKIGDIVNYHDIIGGEITSRNHKISHIGKLAGGTKIAWITGTGKAGAVFMKRLSKVKEK